MLLLWLRVGAERLRTADDTSREGLFRGEQ